MTSKTELIEILSKYFANTNMTELCQDLLCIVGLDPTEEFHTIIAKELKVLAPNVPELEYTLHLFNLITIFARSKHSDRIELSNSIAIAIAEVTFARQKYYREKKFE